MILVSCGLSEKALEPISVTPSGIVTCLKFVTPVSSSLASDVLTSSSVILRVASVDAEVVTVGITEVLSTSKTSLLFKCGSLRSIICLAEISSSLCSDIFSIDTVDFFTTSTGVVSSDIVRVLTVSIFDSAVFSVTSSAITVPPIIQKAPIPQEIRPIDIFLKEKRVCFS